MMKFKITEEREAIGLTIAAFFAIYTALINTAISAGIGIASLVLFAIYKATKVKSDLKRRLMYAILAIMILNLLVAYKIFSVF
ncbi:MAG: hypothetical protein J4432_03180 [DPANN group archaeon]|nr:hypothetical protein [DPANN group archaeon]